VRARVCVAGDRVTVVLLMCHSSSWPGPGGERDHAVALGFVIGEFAERKLFPDGASEAIWHWLNSQPSQDMALALAQSGQGNKSSSRELGTGSKLLRLRGRKC